MKKPKSIPPTYFYACIFLCLPFYFVLNSLKVIPFPYNLLGILLIPLGIYLVISPWYLFKDYNTPEDFSETTAFVSAGIFKYTRNPMYLGGLIILLGIAFTTGNVLALISPALFIVFMERIFIPYEEFEMERLFGDNYLTYKSKVRRWI